MVSPYGKRCLLGLLQLQACTLPMEIALHRFVCACVCAGKAGFLLTILMDIITVDSG